MNRKSYLAVTLAIALGIAGPAALAASVIPDAVTTADAVDPVTVNTPDGTPTTATDPNSSFVTDGLDQVVVGATTTTTDTTTDTTTTTTITTTTTVSYTDDVVVPGTITAITSSVPEPTTGVITSTVSYDDGTGTILDITVISTPTAPVVVVSEPVVVVSDPVPGLPLITTGTTDVDVVGVKNLSASGVVSGTTVSAGTMETSAVVSTTTDASLVNSTGHGVVVSDTATVISGGTTSTTLTLDDTGATFADTVTGGPALVHGVADGVVATDAVNKGQLDAEATARSTADAVLTTAISDEATTRASADTVLQSNIDTEATTRAAADTTLQGNITAEQVARINADTLQDARVSAVENDMLVVRENIDELTGGVALAIAAGSHQFDLSHTGFQLSAAGGFYDGENAVSIAAGGAIGNVFVSANIGTSSQQKTGGGVAVGIKF